MGQLYACRANTSMKSNKSKAKLRRRCWVRSSRQVSFHRVDASSQLPSGLRHVMTLMIRRTSCLRVRWCGPLPDEFADYIGSLLFGVSQCHNANHFCDSWHENCIIRNMNMVTVTSRTDTSMHFSIDISAQKNCPLIDSEMDGHADGQAERQTDRCADREITRWRDRHADN